MEEGHTPAGYCIAIFVVLGTAWFMPPLPVLILLSPLLVFMGIAALALYGTVRQRGFLDRIAYRVLFPRTRIR